MKYQPGHKNGGFEILIKAAVLSVSL